MEPFPESAVLSWVLGLGITALVIGCMIVGLIARLWPFSTHSWSEKDQRANPRSKPSWIAGNGLPKGRACSGQAKTRGFERGCGPPLPRLQVALDHPSRSRCEFVPAKK